MITNVYNNVCAKQDTTIRAAVESAVILIKLGMDVHAERIAVCVQLDGGVIRPAQLVLREALLGWIEKLRAKHPGARVVSCYEAGPLGYHLHRQLVAAGVENLVVVPKRLGDRRRRQKTDRLDARELGQALDAYLRGNRHALGVVRVPTPEQERVRARVRLRDQLMRSRRQYESRGRSFLLTQGVRVRGAWWKPGKWEVLKRQLPSWVAEQVEVWQQLAVELDRRERLVRQELEEAAPKILPKAVGALTWVVLAREILDWGRFKNRRQVASYTGLCPGIHQSGSRSREGSINRCGNQAVRHALIELVWRLVRYQPQYPPIQPLVEGGLSVRERRKAAVAAARRLAIDLWRVATGQCSAGQLGLILR